MHTYELPERLGSGCLREIPIQQGITLYIGKYSVHTPLHVRIIDREPAFEFGFCVSGKGVVNIPGLPEVKSGLHKMLYSQKGKMTVIDEAASYRLCATVAIEKKLFSKLFMCELTKLPVHLQLAAKGLMNDDYFTPIPVDPACKDILHQILTPGHGLEHSHLHYKGKAYELLSLCMNRFGNAGLCREEERNTCSPEHVCQAAEILVHSMENPPTLTSLSKVLSTSHVTLNKGFRQAFGTTVFGYLRRIRLEKARHLLESGATNVTEASLAVGYNSIPTFSRAFLEHHGVPPIACRKGLA